MWVEAKGTVPTSEEYEATAADIQNRTHASPIHPYNDVRTIAGQGTCALEFLQQQPDLEYLLAPVGGGTTSLVGGGGRKRCVSWVCSCILCARAVV